MSAIVCSGCHASIDDSELFCPHCGSAAIPQMSKQEIQREADADLNPADRPDYLLSGHSHMPDDQRVGPTRRINPGALHRADEYTTALLDLETDSLQFLSIPR